MIVVFHRAVELAVGVGRVAEVIVPLKLEKRVRIIGQSSAGPVVASALGKIARSSDVQVGAVGGRALDEDSRVVLVGC
jgi:hypothetical protein